MRKSQRTYFKLITLICLLVSPSICEILFPKILWIYWANKDQLSIQRQMFLAKIEQHISIQPEWKLNFLNDNNYKQFLPNQIPFDLNQIKKPALKSDLIRLSLLCQYGGMWVDLTSIFIQDFNWVQNILNDSNVINRDTKYSQQPDVLMFQWQSNRYKNFYTDNNGNKKNNDPGYESWFILAKKQSKFVCQWKNVFLEYFFYDTQTIFTRLKSLDIYMGYTSYTSYLKVYFAQFEILHKKQLQLDRNTSILQRITSHQYYKIWTIDCSIGPCIVYYYQPRIKLPHQFQITTFSMNQNKMVQFYKKQKLRYLIKFVSYRTQQLINLLNDFNSIQNKNKSLTQIFYQRENQIISCKHLQFIADDSLIYNRLLKNNPFSNNYKKTVSPEQRLQYYKFCEEYENNESYLKVFKNYLKSYYLLDAQYIVQLSLEAIIKILLLLFLCFAFYKCSLKECDSTKNHNYVMVDFLKIDYLSIKMDSFLRKLNLQIPYPILAIIYAYPVYYGAMNYERMNYRQMYEQTMWITVLSMIGHKFSKIHILHSKYKQKWLVLYFLVEQLIYLCIAKLVCQLIYNRWLPMYCYTLFFGFLMPSVINCLNSVEVKKHRVSAYFLYLNNKHFFIVALIICAFGLIPNLPFMMIKGIYIKSWIVNIVIGYCIYLTFVLFHIYFKVFNFYQMMGKQIIIEKSKIIMCRSIRRILLHYWLLLLAYFIYYKYDWLFYSRTDERTYLFNVYSLILAIYYETLHVQMINYPKNNIQQGIPKGIFWGAIVINIFLWILDIILKQLLVSHL